MKNKEKFEEALKRMVRTNLRAIKYDDGLGCSSNVNFIGEITDFEENLKDFCLRNGISLKVIDVIEEENKRTDFSSLFDELNYTDENENCSLLYLKNYTKARPNVRYRFSAIYKNLSVPTSGTGIVVKENLQYLGTVMLSSKDDVFPLDDSEKSCFRHVEIE